MRSRTKLQTNCKSLAAVLLMLGTFHPKASAQLGGEDAVWCGSGSSCNNPPVTNSPAYIDASVFNNNGGGTDTNDVCLQIQGAFHSVPTNAPVVIDARGAQPLTGGSYQFNCSGTPWVGSLGNFQNPAEILLPAGLILINQTWIIPNNTRVFGAGGYGEYSSLFTGTTLEACNTNNTGTCSLSTGSPMIQFGNSTLCPSGCTGISVEYVDLFGSASYSSPLAQPLVGVLNQYAGTGSYVNHMSISYVGQPLSGAIGVGLQIGPPPSNGSAAGSGPYTNLFVTPKGSHAICVKIEQSNTLGLHGITCTDGGSVAIYLDASNTTIEDAHIENYIEGVQIGANQAAQGDTLINISAGGSHVQLTDIVHICGGYPPSSGGTGKKCSTNGANAASDVSLIGIANVLSGDSAANNIQDDETATLISADKSGSNPPYYGVGVYALGEPFGTTRTDTIPGGYTRFSTSTGISSSTNPGSVPSWGVGSSGPGSGSGVCPPGSIFSNTAGTILNNTLYICNRSGQWKGVN